MSEFTEAARSAAEQANTTATQSVQVITALFRLCKTIPLDDPRYQQANDLVEQASQTSIQALRVLTALDLLLEESAWLDRKEG